MSADVVIQARDLRKVYRLYAKPQYRLLDMFGLLGARPGAYTEHAALDGVTLEVRRGEKVAVIGRNGAGKSTLLKLVTRVIEPTSGAVSVAGRVHALLQIGTGFHPDFTGRENVYAYLAQLGVTGREAERRCAEIVEFAELEEYIDQPVKTYSTGMGVRLMFATSAAITPDLLVLDEVLGVGDAYFAQKSYERIREMCEAEGTTLLLVTHDIYSALKLCSRVLWIDQGRLLMDGDGPTVVRAYEDSIRQQEEARLRRRKQARLEGAGRPSGLAAARGAILEIQAAANRALPAPVYFSRIEVAAGGETVALPLDADAFDETRAAHLQREATAWGEPIEWEGRQARALLNYGSPFHKVAGVVPALPGLATGGARVTVDYSSPAPFRASVRLFVGDRVFECGTIAAEPGGWRTWEGTTAAGGAAHAEVNPTGVYGTGVVSITAIALHDETGHETHFVRHGAPVELRVGFRIHKPDLAERPQVLVAFHREGVLDVCRLITRDLVLDARRARDGEVRLRIPSLRLGNGTYTVTVMVARPGYYDEEQTRYFSLNPGVYACHTRALEIVVTGGDAVATGTVFVEQGTWSLHA